LVNSVGFLFFGFLLYKISSNQNLTKLYRILPNFTKFDRIARVRFFLLRSNFQTLAISKNQIEEQAAARAKRAGEPSRATKSIKTRADRRQQRKSICFHQLRGMGPEQGNTTARLEAAETEVKGETEHTEWATALASAGTEQSSVDLGLDTGSRLLFGPRK
jgi:hypothetical protein